MDHKNNVPAAKAFIALLILAVAFMMLVIFSENKDTILANNQFQLYMVLATLGAGLLIGLLYFVSKPHPTHNPKKSKSKKTKRK